MGVRSMCAVALALVALAASSVAADTVSLEAIRDTSLCEDMAGAQASGGTPFVFAGVTNQPASRRAIVAFDLSTVPLGARIDSVTLTLEASRVAPAAPMEPLTLHRMLADWGEGTTTSPRLGGGECGTAMPGDATWTAAFLGATAWASAGGDFEPVPSATAPAALGSITFGSTAAMVADVQSWVDDAAASFGWILLGNEAMPQTAVRFGARENPDPAARPRLLVDFTLPPQLSIEKDAIPSSVGTDEPVTFEVHVANLSASPIVADLVDQLPTCLVPPLDCFSISCSAGAFGSPPCGDCSVVGDTITITDYELAPDDMAAGGDDELWFVLDLVAGSMPGTCTNTASTEDPLLGPISDDATVDIVIIDYAVLVDKQAATPQVIAGAPAVWDIAVRNESPNPFLGERITDTIPTCLEPPADCSSVTCSAGSFGMAPCGDCAVMGRDVVVTDYELGPGDETTYTIEAVAGPMEGDCVNTVVVLDPFLGQVVDDATVEIRALAATLSKVANEPVFTVNEPVSYTVTIDNSAAAALDLIGCSLIDDMGAIVPAGCVTLTDGSCASTPGLGPPATCSGDRVEYAGFDVPAGTTQVIRYDATTGTEVFVGCINQVELTCGNLPTPLTGQAPIEILPPPCDLNGARVAFPPVVPSRASPWVYSLDCLTEQRIDPLGPTGRVVTGAVSMATFDQASPGPPGTLELYQTGCFCTQRIALSKDRVADELVLTLW